MGSDAVAAATAAWRRESGRLLAALVRITHDLDLAEDLAQDAMLAALDQWPREGIPSNTGAWLTAVAKRRAVDHFRRGDTRRRLVTELGHAYREAIEPDDGLDTIEDDVLRLIFLTCHPALAPQARAALTLRLVCGLTTTEISRAFLVKDATVGQRISRAKRALAHVGVSMELPVGEDRARRLADVMAVVYLIFNEGYSATAGQNWIRSDLCHEALRLSRLLIALAPAESEVHGLNALLELQASRLEARIDANGTPVLLEAQDRNRWDRLLIHRGVEALDRARKLDQPAGPYVLQAAIAATHASAQSAEATDWRRIAELYDVLAVVTPSPIVEVNRAVAHGRAHGPAAGLAVLEPLAADPVLAASHLLPSVRGDLLARAGDTAGAAVALRAAASLTRNGSERALLIDRADRMAAEA